MRLSAALVAVVMAPLATGCRSEPGTSLVVALVAETTIPPIAGYVVSLRGGATPGGQDFNFSGEIAREGSSLFTQVDVPAPSSQGDITIEVAAEDVARCVLGGGQRTLRLFPGVNYVNILVKRQGNGCAGMDGGIDGISDGATDRTDADVRDAMPDMLDGPPSDGTDGASADANDAAEAGDRVDTAPDVPGLPEAGPEVGSCPAPLGTRVTTTTHRLLAISADDAWLAVTDPTSWFVFVLPASPGTTPTQIAANSKDPGAASVPISRSPAGAAFAVHEGLDAGYSGMVRLWTSGGGVRALARSELGVARFAPNGSRFFFSDWNAVPETGYLIDLPGGTTRSVGANVPRALFSPDSRWLGGARLTSNIAWIWLTPATSGQAMDQDTGDLVSFTGNSQFMHYLKSPDTTDRGTLTYRSVTATPGAGRTIVGPVASDRASAGSTVIFRRLFDGNGRGELAAVDLGPDTVRTLAQSGVSYVWPALPSGTGVFYSTTIGAQNFNVPVDLWLRALAPGSVVPPRRLANTQAPGDFVWSAAETYLAFTDPSDVATYIGGVRYARTQDMTVGGTLIDANGLFWSFLDDTRLLHYRAVNGATATGRIGIQDVATGSYIELHTSASWSGVYFPVGTNRVAYQVQGCPGQDGIYVYTFR